MRKSLAIGIGLVAMMFASPAIGDRVTMTTSKDNTLIDSVITKTTNSNGVGDAIYAGKTGPFANNGLLRAVLAFDLSAIPAGSTINSVSLTLVMIQTISGDQTHTLHRVTKDWGQGISEFVGGVGAPAEPGDATWIHTFYPDAFWTNPGGDFVEAASASTTVGEKFGPCVWSSPGMIADVQVWVDNPASNFGWLMKGNEIDLLTAKRFASRENFLLENIPQLVIDYTPPTPCPADIAPPGGNGTVNVNDLLAVINAWGACP